MFVGNGKPRKPLKREEARELRRQGIPIKRIAKDLGVSSSSVSYWTRDIRLTPEQRRRNLRGPTGPQNPQAVQRRADEWRRRSRAKRLRYQQEGRARAREGDALHMAGCLLYWAEGTKSRNTVCFANSDIAMVRFFVHFLRQSLGVPSEDLTLRLNLYTNNGLSIGDVEEHWLDALGLPRAALRGHTLNHIPTSSSGNKRNRLPYGVGSVRVLRRTTLARWAAGKVTAKEGAPSREVDGVGRHQSTACAAYSTTSSRSAFWAWRRFSAWSKTAERSPYSTSSVISSPGCAGRQWRTIA
jgi:transposase